MTSDPTPPHDQEYRAQQAFRSQVACAPNALLDNMVRGLTRERLEVWQLVIVNEELDRRQRNR